MTNSNKAPGDGLNPTKEEIKAARSNAGLSQPGAAALIYKSAIAWKKWESGERKMPADTWELFNIKVKGGD